MQFILKIELGNDAMRTQHDVRAAIYEAFSCELAVITLQAGDISRIYDTNGNTVGKWEVIEDAAPLDATEELVHRILNKDAALESLTKLMRKHDRYGASDSEGWQAVRRVEYAVDEGKTFPLQGRNPFQIYESIAGWETASAELVAAAQVYWKALVEEKLGITIA